MILSDKSTETTTRTVKKIFSKQRCKRIKTPSAATLSRRIRVPSSMLCNGSYTSSKPPFQAAKSYLPDTRFDTDFYELFADLTEINEVSKFESSRPFEDRLTVKKTLEFGSGQLHARVVGLHLDEELLEAARVEFTREQATALAVAPNHFADFALLTDEGDEVAALGNGYAEQALCDGGQTQEPGAQIDGSNDDGKVCVGEIHLHDAASTTGGFFIAWLSCAMKKAGLSICISRRSPPGKKTDRVPE